MSNTHGFVQFPVDGQGKKAPSSVMIECYYENGTIDFAENLAVSFSTSTWTGTIVEVDGTTASGELHIRINEPVPATPALVNGENIIIDAQTYATVSSTTRSVYYFPQNVIAGGSNMTNTLEITDENAAKVTFAGGSPGFDAFGRQQISEATFLGEYLSKYAVSPLEWDIEEDGAATITHIPAHGANLLATTTADGDRAAMTTHLYHKYELGQSQLLQQSLAIGDTGKADVTRVWGYGDSTDGLFFRLQDTTLQVMIRSTTISDLVVDQDDWNIDRMNGEAGEFNPTGLTLDVSKNNIYWIDLQWLGAGRVRFGVIMNGTRYTCHEFNNANVNTAPYMRTGSLPVHYGIVNTAATGSTSEMRVWCSVVSTEGKFQPNESVHFRHIRANEKQDGGKYKKAIMNWHPGRVLFALRPALTVNGVTNRQVAIPTRLSMSNEGSSTMWVQARRDAKFIGSPTWSSFHTESSLEYTEDAFLDMDNRGTQTGMWAIPPNSTENIDITDVFDYRKEHIHLDADGVTQSTHGYSFTCWNMETIIGGSDATDWTCTFAAAGNTITKTAGTDFDTEGFVAGQMMYVRNSDTNQNDGYYIITNVTSTILTVEEIDGSTTSFTSETATAGVTLQAGTKSFFFGSINVAEIDS